MPASLSILLKAPSCVRPPHPPFVQMSDTCIVDGPESRVVFLSFCVTSLHSSLMNLYQDTGGLTGGGIGPERSWVMVGVVKLASATCYLYINCI